VVDHCSALLDNLSDPKLPALSFYRGRTCEGRLTYGELSSKVASLSGYLANDIGLKVGDRVLILSPNSLEVPVLLLALWRIGAVVVPLNPNTGEDEWGFIAEHSEARGLLVSKEFFGRFPNLKKPLDFKLSLENFLQYQSDPILTSRVSGSELAIVLYTSGTTGSPKGVGLSQRNLMSNGLSMARNFDFSQTTQFAVLPLYHAHALGFGLMSALTTQGHLVFTDKLDPFSWAEVIEKESVTFTSVVPTLLPLLLASRVHQKKIPLLKAILVSSAPLSQQIAREFEEKTELRLMHGWGLSEYTNFACAIPSFLDEKDRKTLIFNEEGTSVGSPLPGTDVKVIAHTGGENPLTEGEKGELCVRGASLMLGYYKDTENTRQTMTAEGWLRTGDEGFYRHHKDHPIFFITGRIKEIIIRGGEKVSPLAVEKKIFSEIPELAGKMVVLGFPHQLYGEEVGAYIELETLSDSVREKLVKTLEKISPDSRPKIVLFSSSPIPRTHTGKIQRRKLLHFFTGFKNKQGAIKILSSQEPSGT
jgi:acyl-CoA synthetase (AMP-forming)/AMP-acid ligase II